MGIRLDARTIAGAATNEINPVIRPRRDNMKRLPLVYIEWDDHHANASWQDTVDHDPAHCMSVGWLYHEDHKGVTLISNVTDDSVGNSQFILKSCITKRKVVKR